ncbi:hypothetical protein FJZ23_01640 [Candidatus Parcubacteria bacterium]|nr:hypothetical protein [Candidatus Parcubacteria bacterium]
MTHVIIGGGIAGTTAAEELRKRDPRAVITLVSQEQHPLYSRVLLPHYLKGKIPRERVFLKKESWYEEHGIEWLRGISVVALNARNNYVALSDGRELPYDRLLIATGGDVRMLDGDVRGVSYLRTLDDADHLDQLLGELPAGGRAGIYGGGFIACEYLNLFAHFGRPMTIAFRGPHFWSGTLESEVGEFLNAHLREQGVEVRPGERFLKTVGDKVLEGFATDAGTYPCGVLGIGIGIKLEDTWMREAGLKSGSGILCDEYLRTNLPDVYAAGDVAQYFDPRFGRHLCVGNWMNAQMQGRAVARNMAGEASPFSLVSSYATQALGLEIIAVGDTLRDHADEVRVIGSKEEGIGQHFLQEGKLIGAVLLGRNTDRAWVTKEIGERC